MFSQDRSRHPQPRQPFPGNIILWFIVLGLTILFIPLFLFSRSLNQEVAHLEGTVVPLETAVSSLPLDDNSSAIQELTLLNEQIVQIDTLSPTLDAKQIIWSDVMQTVRTFDSSEISILSLAQAPGRLTIRGRATDESAITAYVQQLEQSGSFNRVIMQSILVVETPFVVESPTPLGPTATARPTNHPTAVLTRTPFPTQTAIPTRTPIPPTATQDLTDEFEWDDHQAQPIFLGAPQRHNFLPNYDVDNVYFLAKAGRFYQIRTTNLAAGVDTFLTVSNGEQILTNDDTEPGTLASFVEVQAPPDQDINVFVRITNRGTFGATQSYQISVQEIVPTAVPTELPLTAVPTITATPDLRDQYEPDDPPTLLAVGESQLHTFFPSVDIDHLQLLVKEGRNYQISTSNLAVGVDTVVTVDLDSIFFENDDTQPLGSDDLSSSICFSAPKDSVALIDIRNKGQQFGIDKHYTVSANEVPFSSDRQHISFGNLAVGSGAISNPVQLSSSINVSFTIGTETPWILVDLVRGMTSETLSPFNVIADPTGLVPGEYLGAVTISWDNVCHQVIPVELTILDTTGQVESLFPVAQQPFDGINVEAATRPYKIQLKRVRLQDGTSFEFVIVVEFDT